MFVDLFVVKGREGYQIASDTCLRVLFKLQYDSNGLKL